MDYSGYDYAGMLSANATGTITWGATTAGTTTQYVNLGQQQYWNGLQAAGLVNGSLVEAPTEKRAKKPKRELSANEQWLNDRVNEMRVKL